MLKPQSWAVMIAWVLLGLAGQASGQVIISEIMYNPASSEKFPNDVEWVEIFNAGTQAVDIRGWYLADEDGRTAGVAEGVRIEPGAAVVLVPGVQTAERFHAAWGPQPVVVPLGNWGQPGKFNLANDPSPHNEVLTLRASDNSLIDEVNFDDEGDWPSDAPPGASIYVLPGKLDSVENDLGSSWARSVAGKHGAKTNRLTPEFDGIDTGSPGVVEREAR
jgi:hypothetical protein